MRNRLPIRSVAAFTLGTTLFAAPAVAQTAGCTFADDRLACPAPVVASLGSPKTTELLEEIARSDTALARGPASERFRQSVERERAKAERDLRRMIRRTVRGKDRAAAYTAVLDARRAMEANYNRAIATYFGREWYAPGDNPDIGPDEPEEALK